MVADAFDIEHWIYFDNSTWSVLFESFRKNVKSNKCGVKPRKNSEGLLIKCVPVISIPVRSSLCSKSVHSSLLYQEFSP